MSLGRSFDWWYHMIAYLHVHFGAFSFVNNSGCIGRWEIVVHIIYFWRYIDMPRKNNNSCSYIYNNENIYC